MLPLPSQAPARIRARDGSEADRSATSTVENRLSIPGTSLFAASLDRLLMKN
jgi:hypothetical protein